MKLYTHSALQGSHPTRDEVGRVPFHHIPLYGGGSSAAFRKFIRPREEKHIKSLKKKFEASFLFPSKNNEFYIVSQKNKKIYPTALLLFSPNQLKHIRKKSIETVTNRGVKEK
jgi:hypothetical protein